MVGDHIPTILAGNCMAAKVIKCTARAQGTLGALKCIKAQPSYDGNLKNWGIHVKPQAIRGHNGKPGGSMGQRNYKRRALSATEDEFSSKLKSWSSNKEISVKLAVRGGTQH